MPRRRPSRLSEPAVPTIIPPPVPDHPSQLFTPNDQAELKAILHEQARREMEALRLYEPLPKTSVFHETSFRIKLIIGSNRAGKTLGACKEIASAVTGQDPYGKYPKANGVAFFFGVNESHLGTPMYEKLFRPGSFRMIRDLVTGRWRAFRPIADANREKNEKGKVITKPSLPLIDRRFIKSISWRDKKAHIPKLITLTNGWELYWFSSNAELPRGQDIDLAWLDEEMSREDLIEELLPRLADRGGTLIWSATPQVASAQLYDLHDRAQSGQVYTENSCVSADGDVHETHCHIVDNPHIDQEEKDRMFRGWNEDQRRVRWEGKFLFSSLLVYSEFALAVHAWPENVGWQVPSDWCRYIVVDPGHQRCAVLFMAIPPNYLGNYHVAYDELYIKDCDAELFGKSLRAKSQNVIYELAIIDKHAAIVTEMGSGRNVEEQYRQAMVKNEIHFRNGCHFLWGSDDVQGGLTAVRSWLGIGHVGTPGFYFHLAKCPNLKWEFERYRLKVEPKTKMPTDVPVKKNDHLMDCLRYAAMRNLSWRRPKEAQPKRSAVYDAMQKKKQRQLARGRHDSGAHISLGVGKCR